MAGEHYIAYWNDETVKYIQLRFRTQKSNGLVLHVDPYNNDQLHYKLEKSVDASKSDKDYRCRNHQSESCLPQ